MRISSAKNVPQGGGRQYQADALRQLEIREKKGRMKQHKKHGEKKHSAFSYGGGHQNMGGQGRPTG